MATYVEHSTKQSDLDRSLGRVARTALFVTLGEIAIIMQEILVVIAVGSARQRVFQPDKGDTYFHMASQPSSTSDLTPSCHHFRVAAAVISDHEPFSDDPTPEDQIDVVTVAGGS